MSKARNMAFGGVLAALAVVIMTMGGLIPFFTYVCPMLCCIILMLVTGMCGNRVGWAWYGSVSILGLLLAPDKEAAAVFLALGYYPIIMPFFNRLPLSFLWKLIYFNAVTLVLYWALLNLFGLQQLMSEFQELGTIGLVITLLLGNVCFLLLDMTLKKFGLRMKRKK